jgi:ribosomal protein L23
MAKTTKTTKEVSKEVKITSVLKNPCITEKAAKSQSYNAYLFDVSTSATKSEIMKAFVKQYKHKPLKFALLMIEACPFHGEVVID